MAEHKDSPGSNSHIKIMHESSYPREPQSTRRDYAGAQTKIDPKEIRLVRKLDIRIMPILWLMYFWNYIDRGALAQARLNALEEDLDMSGDDFNTAVSILTVGYVLMQIPSNMLITRVRPSVYLASCALIWSTVSACTGLVNSYGNLIACRFLLGFLEAPYYPGALYLLSIFYTRKEIASRVAILFSAQMAGLGFANLIAAGIFDGLHDIRGLSGWRWLLILEGTASGLTAIAAFWFLPNTQERTRWLDAEERELAQRRMERDRLVRTQEHESVWDGLRHAIQDRRTWLFCAVQNFHYAGLSFINFLPTVIQTLGFGDTAALLLACPPYISAGVATILLAWSSGKYHERTLHITAGFSVAMIGFVTAASTLNPAGRYVACFIFPMGAYSVNSVIVGWTATTLSQSSEKKAVVLAMTNVSAQIASVYSAYLWPKSDGPRYVIGFSASAAFCFAALLVCWFMRFLLKRENERVKQERERGTAELNIYGY
ncbi:major facilitator superfamily transporter [Xylariales sp. AK1849]|nr:major facilitator superfamily transporter [Xylariales sp. AK1849]